MKVKFEIHDLREVARLVTDIEENLSLIRSIIDRIYLDPDLIENDGDNITNSN